MHGHQLQRVVALAGLVLAGFERGVGQEGGQVVAELAGDLAVLIRACLPRRRSWRRR
jgi:hypothetical protein